MENPEISVVTTVYKTAEFLSEFYRRIKIALSEAGYNTYEIIFVNDGSPDNASTVLSDLKGFNKDTTIISLSRNFGHHQAIMAGLSHAKGDFVFLIDSDLEVSPDALGKFSETLKTNPDADVIYGYQESRKGGLWEKWLGFLFWKLFSRISPVRVPQNLLTERLMRKNYVSSLLSCGDKNLFLAGMFFWVGYKQLGIPIEKLSRTGTSYSLFNRLNLMIEAVTSFSEVPLRLLFNAGAVISFFSFMYAAFLICRKLLYPEIILEGFTTIITLISITFGITLTSIGMIGIYLSKIFKQVQDRPLYVIKEIL